MKNLSAGPLVDLPQTNTSSYKAYNITFLILKGCCVMKIFRGSYLEKEIIICSPLSGF